MFKSFTVIAAAILLLTTNSYADCSRCTKVIELSQSEWECLGKRLDQYSKYTFEPVYIPISNCSGEPTEKNRSVDTNFKRVIEQASESKVSDARIVTRPKSMQLSKDQLLCLQTRMSTILSYSFDTTRFDFESECGETP